MKLLFTGWIRALLYWLSPDDGQLSTLASGLREQLRQAQADANSFHRGLIKALADADKLMVAKVAAEAECDVLRTRVVQTDGPIWDRIRVMVNEQEQIDGRSGEAKRHQVLARARKEFPDLPTLSLSKLIDAAVEVSH